MRQRCLAARLHRCVKATGCPTHLQSALLSTVSQLETSRKGPPDNRNWRIETLTRHVSRVIKLGKEDVACTLLPKMASQEGPATVVFYNYLLNSCSRARNPTTLSVQMAKEVCKFMERNEVKMNDVSYGCFLRALSRGGSLDEAVELLEVLAKSKEEVKANVVMYNTVLNGCCLFKSKAHADCCLHLMDNQGVPKDEMSYVELIKLSGLLQDAEGVIRWWEELVTNGSPSPSSRCVMIVALCRSKALPEALEALQEMSHVLSENTPFHLLPGKKPRPSTTQSVDAQSMSQPSSDEQSLAQSELAKEERGSGQVKVAGYQEGQAVGSLEGFIHWEVRKELQDAFNALINTAGQAGKHKLAESLFSEMRSLGLRLGIYTFNALLRAVVEGRGIEHALRVVRSMEAVGVQPDTHTFTTLLDGYCRKAQLDKAEALLDRMQDGKPSQRPSQYTFNILIRACVPLDDPERALRVFARMKKSGVIPDSYTYCALLAVCGNVNAGLDRDTSWSRKEVAQRVVAIEKDMAWSGVRHTHASVSALMHVLGSEGMVEAVLQHLRSSQDEDGTTEVPLLDAVTYNTAINSCVVAKQFEVAWDIFKEMRSLGVKPDRYTYNILINACAHRQSMSAAFELMDTMRQEGIAPDMITYNSLIKVTCHSGELEVGLELLKEMKDSGMQPDVATYNTLLASASFHKREELTEYLVEEMRLEKVQPDTHTCLQVLLVYIRKDRMDEAAEALRVLSARMLLDKDSSGQEAVGSDEESPTIVDELLEDAVISAQPQAQAAYTAVLGGLVQGTDDTWEAEQSPWATRLCIQHQLWNGLPQTVTHKGR